jgi:hypothetical protein
MGAKDSPRRCGACDFPDVGCADVAATAINVTQRMNVAA